jgi:hypothetical protein
MTVDRYDPEEEVSVGRSGIRGLLQRIGDRVLQYHRSSARLVCCAR